MSGGGGLSGLARSVNFALPYAHLTAPSHSTSEIIKVFVGEERKLYNLHRSLLCQECPFFEKCLNNDFKEGRTREVSLENKDVDAFDQLVIWIYSKQLPTLEFGMLAETYELAEEFCMEAFKNDIVDEVKQYVSELYMDTTDEMALIAELRKKGHGNSVLVDYLFDQLAFDFVDKAGEDLLYYGDPHKFLEFWADKYSRERFFSEVFNVQDLFIKNGRNSGSNPADDSDCKYHKHHYTKKCKPPVESSDEKSGDGNVDGGFS